MKWFGWLRRSTVPTVQPAPAPVPVWLRAERLAMLWLMDGEEPELTCTEIIGRGLFEPNQYQRAVIHGISIEDYGLFRAVQDVAIEQRTRQYDALSRLGELIANEPGATVDERMQHALVRCPDEVGDYLLELGWIDGE